MVKYKRSHLLKSGWQVLNTLPPFFGLWYLMYLSLFQSYWLTLLLAVLERRAGVSFADRDVFVNLAGGLLLREPGLDLAGEDEVHQASGRLGVRRVPQDVLLEAHDNFQKLSLRALVCIGGDGSLTIAQQLYETGFPVVGIPKTIDNDLDATIMTFGFETAVSTAVDALDRLYTTAQSHNRVMVLEVMGRYAGWIAGFAGLAGGADVSRQCLGCAVFGHDDLLRVPGCYNGIGAGNTHLFSKS